LVQFGACFWAHGATWPEMREAALAAEAAAGVSQVMFGFYSPFDLETICRLGELRASAGRTCLGLGFRETRPGQGATDRVSADRAVAQDPRRWRGAIHDR
jgi:hypothetical protein